jgi:hypothetical protein
LNQALGVLRKLLEVLTAYFPAGTLSFIAKQAEHPVDVIQTESVNISRILLLLFALPQHVIPEPAML